ncbi:MAG: GNAT family N-acetyltransferase [Pseudomonadota bacterium]
MILHTARLRLRPWRDKDRPAFAAMNADPEVMHDLGGPLGEAKSDAKLDRYAAVFEQHGFGRWVVEGNEGAFLGYAGVMPVGGDHPLGAHHEIGWRLVRSAWGQGFASEAARAALADAFTRVGLTEILSYTAPDNLRSQAVMARLGLLRDPARDFKTTYDGVNAWHGLVWTAYPASGASLFVTKPD